MTREFFRIGQDPDGEKYVEWVGWLYGVEGELRLEEMNCRVYFSDVSEWGLREDLILAQEDYTHYISVLTEAEYDEIMNDYFEGEPMAERSFDEVNENTPIGNYYFDSRD